jgi:hypothetical protein
MRKVYHSEEERIEARRAYDRERNHKRRPRKTPVIPKATQEGYQVCKTCLAEKPFDLFKRDNQKKSGYATRCKACYKAQWDALPEEKKEQERRRDRESRLPRKEQINARDRKRHNTDEHRAKVRARKAIKRQARLLEQQNKPPKKGKQLSLFKICPRCKVEKFLNEFPQTNRPGGYGGFCKECNRKWTNSEEEKARQRAIKKVKGLDPEYRKAANDRLNKWRRKHPESQRELTLRRLARKRQATTERVSFKRILERDGRWCHICEKDIHPHQKLVYDHVVPLKPRPGEPQGTHSEDNIHPAHDLCNKRKANKRFEDLVALDRRGVD